MIKRIRFCDFCGKEIENNDERNKIPYLLYKNIKGLWTEQDLCLSCLMKLNNTLKECEKRNEK